MSDAKHLDRLLQGFVDGGLPGCALQISQRGKTIYEGYFGCADIESGKPIASDASVIPHEQLAFNGKIRARHTRGKGFDPPLYEAGATYALNSFNSAGVAVAIPKGSPARELQIRSSAEVGTDILQLSLAVTFRRTAETPLHPLHAAMKARMMF